jgi:hypothetical protein
MLTSLHSAQEGVIAAHPGQGGENIHSNGWNAELHYILRPKEVIRGKTAICEAEPV